MKPLDASDADITRRFQQRFAATVTNTADGFRLQFPGVWSRSNSRLNTTNYRFHLVLA